MRKLLYVLISICTLTANAQDYEWAKSIGGNGISMATDASGNLYVTGVYSDTKDFDPSENVANLTSVGYADIFIAKYDASGNYIWAKSMGGSGYDAGKSIATDASGNVYITGEFRNTSDFDPSDNIAYLTSGGSMLEVFIAKYDASGNYIWATSTRSSFGVKTASSIITDASGNVYVSGSVGNTTDFDPSDNIANLTGGPFLAKYDASGNYVWVKHIGDTSGSKSIALDAFGNICVVGHFNGTVDFDPSDNIVNLTSIGVDPDIFIAKYDASGNYIWAKSIGGWGVNAGYSIATDSFGSIYITGCFRETADFDPSPNIVNLTSASRCIFIAKYDASGNYIWAKSMNGSGGYNVEEGSVIAIDALGNLCVAGMFRGTVDFDPSLNTVNLSSEGFYAIFIAKYDPSGNYIWAISINYSTISGFRPSMVSDTSGNVYVTGLFAGTVDFDPSDNIANLMGNVENGGFIAKYHDNMIPVSIHLLDEVFDNFIVYPNPSNGIFTVERDEVQSQYEVYDVAGKLILNGQNTVKCFTIDLSHLPDGTYLLRVNNTIKLLNKMK